MSSARSSNCRRTPGRRRESCGTLRGCKVRDIKIKFTGMRPGEKMYEELSTLLEDTAPTTHEKIRI